MKQKLSADRTIGHILCIVVALCLLTGCGDRMAASAGSDSGVRTKKPEFHDFEELNGKTISMVTGAPFEEMIRSFVPDVKEFTYFSSLPDMTLAVREGKTDAGLMNNAVAELAANRNPGIAVFPKPLGETAFGIAFAKDDARFPEWQAAYEKIPEETKQELWKKWTGADDSVKTLPEQDWPGAGGTLAVAACDTLEPMSYAGEGGKIIGFDVEMILLMAKELDVHVNFTGMEFAAVLAAVQTGKADIGCGSIVVTDERKEAVNFVEYYPASFVLLVRSVGEESTEAGARGIQSIAQLNDPSYTIGVGIGAASELAVRASLPNATIAYLEGADAYKAVQQGKLDAFAYDLDQLRIVIENGVTGVRLLDGTIGEDIPIAVGISPKTKIPDLQGKMNAFIDELRKDGTLDDMYKRWVMDGNETIPDIPVTEPASEHIIVGTTGVVRPFSYYTGTELSGYDIELAERFGAWMHADIEFRVYDYGAIVIAANTGDVDCIMANLNVTPEREEAMLFSEPLYINRTALMVRDEALQAEDKDFFADVRESFEKTFIRENRWKLFLSGIQTTLLITILSILFGTLLGFGVFMACRNGNPAATVITRFSIWLVQGMPMVVLLMILYYIVFGNVSVSGTFVAVIGFSLVFGAAVYGELCVGVGAVDKGQLEGALALGYGNRQAFYRIILPQAIPHVLPVYRGEIVSLVKATAIVGYIAVQDLTRMGDLIRSRTYDAFFPLIAVAIVYYILAALLTFVIRRITACFDWKKRGSKRILKGVKLHD